MPIWITGGENKSINHGLLSTDAVNVNLFEGWSFDGVNDYVAFTYNSRLILPDADWSLGGWIKPQDNGNVSSWLMSWSWSWTSFLFSIHHNGTHYLRALIQDADADQVITGNSVDSQITLNVWHHVLVNRNGNDFILYIDGREVHRATDATIGLLDSNAPWRMGCDLILAADRFYKGDMCNWAKWDSTLSKKDRNALAGGIDARVIDAANLKWACPMKRGDYSVVGDHFTVTNNGSTDGTTYTATLAAAIDCDGLNVYQGTFDADTYGLTLDGNVFLASNEVQFGNQTWDISGNYNDEDLTLLTAETSTVKLTGAGKTIARPVLDNWFENVWVTGTYTLTAGYLRYDQDATIDGSLTMGSSSRLIGHNDADLDINGAIIGNGMIQMHGMYASHGWIGNDGSLACNYIYIEDPEATSILDPGDYSGAASIFEVRDLTTWAGDSVLKFATGAYIFRKLSGYTQGADDLYFDCTNNPTITITGDYSETNISTGIVIWLAGTSDTITLSGSADQDIGFGSCIGNLIVNKTGGTVTLTADLCCASLDIQDGNFDANGYNVTTGDFTVSNAGDTLTMGSGAWEVSGNVGLTGIGTIVAGTSSLKLTGTGKTYTAPYVAMNDVWVTGSYTVTGDWLYTFGTFTVDGTVTTTATGHVKVSNGNLALNTGGTVTGPGYMMLNYSGITVLDGTWDTTYGYIELPSTGYTFAAGTIDVGTLYVRNTIASDRGIRYGAGTHVFTGDVVYRCSAAGNLTVDMTTNSPTIEYRGDVTVQEDSTGQVIFV